MIRMFTKAADIYHLKIRVSNLEEKVSNLYRDIHGYRSTLTGMDGLDGIKVRVELMEGHLALRCNCCEKQARLMHGPMFAPVVNKEYRCDTCTKNTKGKK